MVLGCLIKSFAFITALMSIAVLASSIAVLVSAVAFSRIDTDDNSTLQTSNSSTAAAPFALPPTKHAGVENAAAAAAEEEMDDENSGFVPEITMTTPLSTTSTRTSNSSILLSEKNEKKNMTVELSTSMSPASTPLANTSSTSNTNPTPSNETTTTSAEDPDNIKDENGSFEDEEKSNSTADVVVVANPKSERWHAFWENQHHFWEEKSDTYIMLIQGSAGTGIFSGFLQLVFSWLLICGMAKDLKDRTTMWNLSNLIVLMLAVVIILIPLTYNNRRDTFNGGGVFLEEIASRIKSLEFSSKTLETILNSIPNFLAEDLALYYYILGVNAFTLLVLLIPSLFCCCCVYPCKKCCCKGKSGRSESDLMLFETGTGGRSATAPGLDTLDRY